MKAAAPTALTVKAAAPMALSAEAAVPSMTGLSVLDSLPENNTYVGVSECVSPVGPGHVICAEHGPLSPALGASTFDMPESVGHSIDAGGARALPAA